MCARACVRACELGVLFLDMKVNYDGLVHRVHALDVDHTHTHIHTIYADIRLISKFINFTQTHILTNTFTVYNI